MTQAESSSIPTLTDVLVPGNPDRARPPAAGAPQRHDDAALPVLTDVIAPGGGAAPPVPPKVEADPDTVVVEPVPTPDVPAVEWPPRAEGAIPSDADAPAEPAAAQRVVAEHAAMDAPLASALAADALSPQADPTAAHGHALPEPASGASVPETAVSGADGPATVAGPGDAAIGSEPADRPISGSAQPAEAAIALTAEDAQPIAERLRNRLTSYLTGAGRETIEARCRDALHDHSAWLVGQITREVALALETEVMDWVRDAVDEEIARRRAGHSG
ncbi:DUF2486 family protein [Burkholderia pseudomultivorans]|uniref:DUF2486 family protein n=1 Tax=Burkholderia pseudomultivorans TaxID=1207504 RepID=UPI0007565C58|nr:DUF2486 family protein [Burkholderia pseudomultivorans]KVG66297.1 hypothetical protein WS80_10035 [Burkholderia pseudomultivorans]